MAIKKRQAIPNPVMLGPASVVGGGSQTPARKYLKFGGDTKIDMPLFAPAPQNYKQLVLANFVFHSLAYGTWGFVYAQNNLLGTSLYYLENVASITFGMHGGSVKYAGVNPLAVDTMYATSHLIDFVGNNFDANVNNTGIESTTSTETNRFNNWVIGWDNVNTAGAGFIGVISDVQVYKNDALTHHWVIDDDVADSGTIIDSVNGANGTLTLGSGSWVDSPFS